MTTLDFRALSPFMSDSRPTPPVFSGGDVMSVPASRDAPCHETNLYFTFVSRKITGTLGIGIKPNPNWGEGLGNDHVTLLTVGFEHSAPVEEQPHNGPVPVPSSN
jgi:hypothetical protein